MSIEFDAAEALLRELAYLQDVQSVGYDTLSGREPKNISTSRATVSSLASEAPSKTKHVGTLAKAGIDATRLSPETQKILDLFVGDINKYGELHTENFTKPNSAFPTKTASTLPPGNRVTPLTVDRRIIQVEQLLKELGVKDVVALEEAVLKLPPETPPTPSSSSYKISNADRASQLRLLPSTVAERNLDLALYGTRGAETVAEKAATVATKTASTFARLLRPLTILLSAIEPRELGKGTISEMERLDREQRMAAMLAAVNKMTGRNKTTLGLQ